MKILRVMLLILLFLTLMGNISAQSETPVISPELDTVLDDLETWVQANRGLDLLEPVDRRFPTAEEVQAFFDAGFEEELTDEVIFEATQFYRAFDFMGADVDLRAIYVALLKDQIGGYYDPESKEMNTILMSGGTLGDSLPLLEQLIYAHEFTHTLQDQHFDLQNFMENSEAIEEEETDQILARQALVEGDATLVMQDFTLWYAENTPNAWIALLALSVSEVEAIPPGTPKILENELNMPYLDGMEFVMAVRDQGGWEAVNEMFENPPVSTEQIFHPEKYLEGEAPIEVAVNLVDDILGAGWTVLDESTLGEFYLFEYLKTQLDPGDAADAAAGWGGDRYLLYHNANANENAWVMRLVWDSVEDREEFVVYYSEFAGSRFGTETSAGVATCWEDAETQDTVCIALAEVNEDPNILLMAYAPDLETALNILTAQYAAV